MDEDVDTHQRRSLQASESEGEKILTPSGIALPK